MSLLDGGFEASRFKEAKKNGSIDYLIVEGFNKKRNNKAIVFTNNDFSISVIAACHKLKTKVAKSAEE